MDTPKDEGGGHFEEPKPSCPERKEHVACDDGQMVRDSVNPPQLHEKSPMVETKSFTEGNVVEQPELKKKKKKKEDKDDVQQVEVRQKSRVRTKTIKRRVGERLPGMVCCTACARHVNQYEESIYRHPALNVLICKNCHIYVSDDISFDSTKVQKQCRWCAEGGRLIFCNFCSNLFCTKCIRRNLGENELSKAMDNNIKWSCYICQPEPLMDLVAVCNSVFDSLSCFDQQSKKRKLVSDKSGNKCDQSEKLKQGSSAEEAHQVYNPSRDTAPRSLSTLQMSEALIEQTKAFIENVRETNTTFLKHLQQKSPYSEVSPSERSSQYEIMNSVVREIHNAQEALEDCLSTELSKLVVKEVEDKNKEKEKENA
ncbi:transcriptional regulator ATRX-like [Sminthopsis crassicaudata]|uniref:transcriptional regulator ATRX-like n=1 Tax=Sminthopsis crassicaudata TaxID=9301 RepID=UPI003D69F75D